MAAPVQGDSKSSSIKTVLMIVVPLISGGGMGAFINHYYSNVQTIVTYSVITTSLGAGQTTKSVLPDLKLLMGNVELPAVYTHTIEFKHNGGPELDRATVGISIAGTRQPKLLGNVLPSSPDPVHRISCQGFDQSTQSVTCTVGQISQNINPYRIVVATDQPSDITLAIEAKNTKIQRAEGPSQEKRALPFTNDVFLLTVLITAMVMMTLGLLVFYRDVARRSR